MEQKFDPIFCDKSTLDKQKEDILNFLKKIKVHYEDAQNLSDEPTIVALYNLMVNNIILDEEYVNKLSDVGIYYNYVGIYQHQLHKSYEHSIHYFQLAIDHNCLWGYINMAAAYFEKKEDDIAIQYLKTGIEKGDVHAMHTLALYYKKIEDFDNMKIYYLMAIEKCHVNSMIELGLYYRNKNNTTNEDIKKALEYLIMAHDHGNDEVLAMIASTYIWSLGDNENGLKYYQIGVEKGNITCIRNLALYYQLKDQNLKLWEKYILMAIEKGDYKSMYDYAMLKNSPYNNQNSKNIEEDVKEAIKYLNIVIDNKDKIDPDFYIVSILELVLCYKKLKDVVNAEKYLLISFENNIFKNLHHFLSLLNELNKPINDEIIFKYLKNIINENELYNVIKHYEKVYSNSEQESEPIEQIKKICESLTEIDICKLFEFFTYKEGVEFAEKYHIKYNNIKHQFMKNKYQFKKTDICYICFDEKEIIPYDCFGHFYCEECYLKLDKCPTCNIERHPVLNKKKNTNRYLIEFA